MSVLMGGISREPGVLYLCVNQRILITVYSTWISELRLTCVCVCVHVSVYVREKRANMLVHRTQQCLVALHAVDLYSRGLGSADPRPDYSVSPQLQP